VIRIAAGGDFRLAADAIVSPNLSSVKVPVIIQKERTIQRVVSSQLIEDGFESYDVVRYVPTEVTEQVGTAIVPIGTAFHTLDVTLNQIAYFNGFIRREYFVQNVDYENEELPWGLYTRMPNGDVVKLEVGQTSDNVVPTPDVNTTRLHAALRVPLHQRETLSKHQRRYDRNRLGSCLA
jgi:hypothetical protein